MGSGKVVVPGIFGLDFCPHGIGKKRGSVELYQQAQAEFISPLSMLESCCHFCRKRQTVCCVRASVSNRLPFLAEPSDIHHHPSASSVYEGVCAFLSSLGGFGAFRQVALPFIQSADALSKFAQL
jgi:hypothetical protein